MIAVPRLIGDRQGRGFRGMARPISYDPDQALDRAMDLFWSRGYREVSVDDLVQSTGLNRHSLYGHYGSKYGLAREALRRYCDESLQRLHEVLSGSGTPT
ncbi:MAG TPA: helix-turn-helix domain-containing protein, partial [Candidatus Limnocylindrales bacterium]|nr:helix-turn-helix domain-containing protein [Candidatus Limnocylindrales bacterium]